MMFMSICLNAQEYAITEHLRMSGIYWSMTAVDLMGALAEFDRNDLISFVKGCQHSCGGKNICVYLKSAPNLSFVSLISDNIY